MYYKITVIILLNYLMMKFISSLISLDVFENVYRYYYCDLSRKEPDLKMDKSVTIFKINVNDCAMDLFI